MGPGLRKPSGPAIDICRVKRPDTRLLLTPCHSIQKGSCKAGAIHTGHCSFGCSMSAERTKRTFLMSCNSLGYAKLWQESRVAGFEPRVTSHWVGCWGETGNTDLPSTKSILDYFAPRFANKSRISVSSVMSTGGASGSAGAAASSSRRMLLTAFTIMNIIQARIKKFNTTVRKLP